MDYNLTQRERQIVVQLLELSRHSKEHFDARIIDPGAAGPSRELAVLTFGGSEDSMELTRLDLRVLKDEGLIYFRWDKPDRGHGRLSSLAFQAAGDNFEPEKPGDAAAAAAAAAASPGFPLSKLSPAAWNARLERRPWARSGWSHRK